MPLHTMQPKDIQIYQRDLTANSAAATHLTTSTEPHPRDPPQGSATSTPPTDSLPSISTILDDEPSFTNCSTCTICSLTDNDPALIERHIAAAETDHLLYRCPGCGLFSCTISDLVEYHMPKCEKQLAARKVLQINLKDSDQVRKALGEMKRVPRSPERRQAMWLGGMEHKKEDSEAGSEGVEGDSTPPTSVSSPEPTEKEPSEAVQRVFETYELLENILLHTSMSTALRAQQVNKTFQHVTNRSMKLQQKLWFKPSPKPAGDSDAPLTFNPLLLVPLKEWPDFNQYIHGKFPDSIRFHLRNESWNYKRDTIFLDLPFFYSRHSANESWRRMMICQNFPENGEAFAWRRREKRSGVDGLLRNGGRMGEFWRKWERYRR